MEYLEMMITQKEYYKTEADLKNMKENLKKINMMEMESYILKLIINYFMKVVLKKESSNMVYYMIQIMKLYIKVNSRKIFLKKVKI